MRAPARCADALERRAVGSMERVTRRLIARSTRCATDRCAVVRGARAYSRALAWARACGSRSSRAAARATPRSCAPASSRSWSTPGCRATEMERASSARGLGPRGDRPRARHARPPRPRAQRGRRRAHASARRCTAPRRMLSHPCGAARARRSRRVAIGRPLRARERSRGDGAVEVHAPCRSPTTAIRRVAFRIEHEGRVGRDPDRHGPARRRTSRDGCRGRARARARVQPRPGADARRARTPPMLQRRITGDRGHLSNEQARGDARAARVGEPAHARARAPLAEDEPARARARGRARLRVARVAAACGSAARVRVIVARQDDALDPIDV